MNRKMFSNEALRKLIIPLVIEQTLVMLVGVVDTSMVSFVGEAAVSGVALIDMVNYLVTVVLAAIDTGGAVIISHYLGRKDKENACKSASQLLFITLLVSLGITIICILFHQILIGLLFGTITDDVRKAAITYFLITALSYPFLGLYNSATAIFRSMERTSVTMYVSLLVNVVNVIGNVIGVFVLRAGVAGVAVPTLIARMAGAVIMVGMSFSPKNAVYVKLENAYVLEHDLIRRILKIAIPNGIENGLFALGKVLVTSIVAVFGTSQIAANGVANSIDMIAIIVVNAMNLAMITVVGQCRGAKEDGQAEYYTRKLMKISYAATGILGVLVIICLPLIRNFYQLSDETWRLACILVVMHNILAFFLHPTSFNLANSLRASGDAKITMYIGIGSMIVFRLGTAWLLGIVFQMGIIGVWIAMGMDWLARSVVFVVRYKSSKWRKIYVI